MTDENEADEVVFDADATIASLRGVIAALRIKVAQAEERGVRMGIEAAARDAEAWFPADTQGKYLSSGVVASIRALDAEAIAKGITTADTLSELAAADAVLLDLPARRVEDWTQNFTRGDSDGDDGA